MLVILIQKEFVVRYERIERQKNKKNVFVFYIEQK